MADMNNPTTLGNLADVANSAAFTSFVNNLVTYLNPSQIAGIVNTNGAWVGQVVSGLNTGPWSTSSTTST